MHSLPVEMHLIHGSGYGAAERQGFKEVILTNTVSGLKAILQAMDTLGISLADADNALARELVLQHAAENVVTIPPEIVEAMDQLWKDAGVQECFSRSSEYQLPDSTQLYGCQAVALTLLVTWTLWLASQLLTTFPRIKTFFVVVFALLVSWRLTFALVT